MAVEDAVAPYLDFELARMHNCYFASTWSGVPMHARAGIRSLQDRWDAYRPRSTISTTIISHTLQRCRVLQ